ncbi:MAG: hypothetical protein JWP89_5662 [Schlesneria sp.]|nr:hypothetical protein [Schlesneria sp.]
MQNKSGIAIVLLSATALTAFVDVWIATKLPRLMLAFRNMDNPEPGPLPVACALVLVSSPIVVGWIAFAKACRSK